jgi:hypothetical protein
MGKKRNRVYLTDKMVLFGILIGAVYWIIDCVLYCFQSYNDNFTVNLFNPTFDELSTRVVVLCLFLIFGSHAQYTINKRKQVEEELLEMKEVVEKLRRDIKAQKNQ